MRAINFKGLLIILALAVTFFFLSTLTSGCGAPGYMFSLLEELEGGTLTGGDEDSPAEIIPGDEDGELIPGGGGDDEWQPPVPDEGEEDSDDDGYPDDDDNFPDRVFYMCVASYGASSAELSLNGIVIFGTNAFDNTDWVRCRVINPMATGNSIASNFTINGKPNEDRIDIAIKEWNPDLRQFIVPDIFTAEMARRTGTPETFNFTFDII